MKNAFGRSCLGLLLILLLGGLAAVSVFAIVFQQSQAVSSNAHTVSATPMVIPAIHATSTSVPLPTANTGNTDPNGGVTIHIDLLTATAVLVDTATSLPTISIASAAPSTNNASPSVTPTDVPRYSGTSSYPLTVTAEVMLGQTHVAGYEAGVSATRTAIAAESASIFATLTAAAVPSSTP